MNLLSKEVLESSSKHFYSISVYLFVFSAAVVVAVPENASHGSQIVGIVVVITVTMYALSRKRRILNLSVSIIKLFKFETILEHQNETGNNTTFGQSQRIFPNQQSQRITINRPNSLIPQVPISRMNNPPTRFTVNPVKIV